MNIQSKSNQPRHASTLIAVLLLAIIVAGALAYYLALVSNECTQVYRSQTWNASLMMAEAGEEEAMSEINVNEGNFTLMTNWIPTAVANGWIPVSTGGNVYYKHHAVDPIGYYDVLINATDPYNPTITVQGTAYWNWSQAEAPHPLLAQAGVTTTPSAIRRVQVRTTFLSLFNAALEAKGQIYFPGTVTVDSYNSSTNRYSYWSPNNVGANLYGLYTNNGTSFQPKRNQNGNVQTDENVLSSITMLGRVAVFGHLDTGPGGTVTFTGNSAAGGTNWVYDSNKGIQPGFSNDDMNVVFPDVQLPNNTWVSLPTGSTGISGSGNYTMTQINLSGNNSNNTFSVTAPTGSGYTFANPMKVALYLPDGLSLSGNGRVIVGTNVSLVIYVGDELALGGNGLANTSQYAPNVTILGLPSLTSVTVSGNGAFYGAIYAPEADAQLNGGGSSGGFYGSLVANTIKVDGGSTVSYDEALRKQGFGYGFVPTSWQEVTHW